MGPRIRKDKESNQSTQNRVACGTKVSYIPLKDSTGINSASSGVEGGGDGGDLSEKAGVRNDLV